MVANVRFMVIRRTVSVYRVLQMRGGGHADVLPVLQVLCNKADAVPCERLQKFIPGCEDYSNTFEPILQDSPCLHT